MKVSLVDCMGNHQVLDLPNIQKESVKIVVSVELNGESVVCFKPIDLSCFNSIKSSYVGSVLDCNIIE